MYESGQKTGDLPKELHQLGKGLARGSNFKALTDAVMVSPNLRRAIEESVCSDILKEFKNASSKANPSMLRSARQESVLKFSWNAIDQEIREKALFFIKFFWPRQTRMHEMKETLAFVLRHPPFLKPRQGNEFGDLCSKLHP